MWPFHVPIPNHVYSLQLVLHLTIVKLVDLKKAVLARRPLPEELENLRLEGVSQSYFLFGHGRHRITQQKNWSSQDNSSGLCIPNPGIFLKCLLNRFGRPKYWSSVILSYMTWEPHLNCVEHYTVHWTTLCSFWVYGPWGSIKLELFSSEVRRLEDPQLV